MSIPFFKPQTPSDGEIVVIKYLKADRSPQCCYGPGDIVGWPREVAQKLIEQGYAQLYDAGKGPGKVNSEEINHLPEPWESGDWGSFMTAQRKG